MMFFSNLLDSKIISLILHICFLFTLYNADNLITSARLTSSENSANKLESKVSQLWHWTSQRTIIHFTNYDNFNLYFRTRPRNYSMIVMMTALKGERKCHICSEAKREYQIVADSYRFSFGHRESNHKKLLFFSLVDFDEGGGPIFESLHLRTAPMFIHYPPGGKPKTIDKLDISRQGFHAEALANWISETANIHIRVLRPPNYQILFGFVLLFLMVMFCGYWLREQLDSLYNPIYWSILSIGIVLVMISGQMWNQIRGPPLVHRNPSTGETGYFSGSSQYQFVAETVVVLMLYFGITCALILLNPDFMPFGPKNIVGLPSRGLFTLCGLILFVFIFSYLLSIFKMKYQGYPYSFLFFS